MKKILFIIAILMCVAEGFAQDAPNGYTTYYGFRKWAQGANPSADSLNANWDDLDFDLKSMSQRIDKIRASTINGHTLADSIIVITKADLGIDTTNYGGVPTTATVNGKLLTSNPVITKADLGIDTTNYGGVPLTRTVNGKALSSDIVITKSDVGLGNVANVDQTNASNITTGTLSITRLPASVYTTTNYDSAQVAMLNQANTFSQPQNVNNTLNANSFIGDGSLISGINANNIETGKISNERLNGEVPLTNDTNSYNLEQMFSKVKTKALYSAPVTVSGTDIDFSLGNVFTKAISSGTVTLTFSNVTPGQIITVVVANSGSALVVWNNSNIRWPDNTAPTQTATKTDAYTFIAVSASLILGTAIQNYTP